MIGNIFKFVALAFLSSSPLCQINPDDDWGVFVNFSGGTYQNELINAEFTQNVPLNFVYYFDRTTGQTGVQNYFFNSDGTVYTDTVDYSDSDYISYCRNSYNFVIRTNVVGNTIYFVPYWRLLKNENLNYVFNDTSFFMAQTDEATFNGYYEIYTDRTHVIRNDEFPDYNEILWYRDLTYNNFYYIDNDAVLGGFTFAYVGTNQYVNCTFFFATGYYNPNDNSDYSNGYKTGYTTGYKDGESTGYGKGYDDGYQAGLTLSDYGSLGGLFGVIADTPIIMIKSLFNFDLFGMNVFVAIMSLLTGLIVLYIVKKII